MAGCDMSESEFKDHGRSGETLKGTPVSPGIAIGKVFMLDVSESIPVRRIPPSKVPEEINRFDYAVEIAKRELHEMIEWAKENLGEKQADIFLAHISLLEDPYLIDGVKNIIKNQLVNAEFAVSKRAHELVEMFQNLKNPYLRERSLDIRDIEKRLLRILTGGSRISLPEPAIVVASQLTPSDTLNLDRSKILGIAVEQGGKTSHAAILARSLEIPAVVGVEGITQKVSPDVLVIVDGFEGKVYIDPSPELLREKEKRREEFLEKLKRYKILKDLPAETKDKYRIKVFANIEVPEEVHAALENGAEGIGLFRTEFFFLEKDTLPSEDEQFEIYRSVLSMMGEKPVIIRTLDLGADKLHAFIDEGHHEPNPALGLRGVRLAMRYFDRLFKPQMRALFRAAKYGKLKILFPIISGAEEARAVIRRARGILRELLEEGMERPPYEVEFGVMVEVPSAAITIDHLLAVDGVSFISIGTNDLVQYTLAVDRGNEKVSEWFRPAHPAVLRLIKQVVDEAKRVGKEVGICGEMAADPIFSFFFVGIGLDELSMSPVAIPEIKDIVRNIYHREAVEIASQVLESTSSSQVELVLKRHFYLKFPETYDIEFGS